DVALADVATPKLTGDAPEGIVVSEELRTASVQRPRQASDGLFGTGSIDADHFWQLRQRLAFGGIHQILATWTPRAEEPLPFGEAEGWRLRASPHASQQSPILTISEVTCDYLKTVQTIRFVQEIGRASCRERV